jgi:aerobic carbon-monoxide dehydrogenase medium subunit
VNAFDYRAPRTLDETLAILHEYGDEARVIAGGTALVTMMRQRLMHPSCVVSVRDVAGLGRIEAMNGSVRLGALVTHREAETSPLLQERVPVLAETFRRVGTIRVRHMATVGGALAHADPNQDPPVTLLALDARVEIRRAGGQRELPLVEFFRDYYESALEPGELVTAVTVPLLPAASGASFIKFLPRTADDYATVAVAATVTLEPDGERCREARIALGSVATTPLRGRAAEALLAGARLDESLVQAAGEAAKEEVDPLDDHRGSAAYKREMTAVMVGRALTQAWADARRAAQGVWGPPGAGPHVQGPR